jgi:hypothetical protein
VGRLLAIADVAGCWRSPTWPAAGDRRRGRLLAIADVAGCWLLAIARPVRLSAGQLDTPARRKFLAQNHLYSYPERYWSGMIEVERDRDAVAMGCRSLALEMEGRTWHAQRET